MGWFPFVFQYDIRHIFKGHRSVVYRHSYPVLWLGPIPPTSEAGTLLSSKPPLPAVPF